MPRPLGGRASVGFATAPCRAQHCSKTDPWASLDPHDFTPAATDEVQTLGAARFRIHRGRSLELRAVPVWTGYLDESGCIPQGTPETSQVLASVLAFPEGSDASVSLTFLPTFCRAAEGQTLPSVPGSPDDCAALVADGAIRWDVIEVTSGFSVVLGPNSELLVGETNVSNKTLQIPAFSGSLNPEAGSIVNGWIFPAVVNLVADQSAQDNLPRLDDVSR